jgi:hypothetical protein
MSAASLVSTPRALTANLNGALTARRPREIERLPRATQEIIHHEQ